MSERLQALEKIRLGRRGTDTAPAEAGHEGVVVEYKHLDRVFAWIAAQQRERDAARLANPKLTLRAKQRIRAATESA